MAIWSAAVGPTGAGGGTRPILAEVSRSDY
jgi:hypothetical protein